MLDSPPCTSSATCYVLTTPVALHNGTLISKVSGYWQRPSDNQYLAKLYDNQYVPNTNIAEYAIGYHSIGKYYRNSAEVTDGYVKKDTTSSTYLFHISPSNDIYAGSSSILSGGYIYGLGAWSISDGASDYWRLIQYTIVQ